MYAVIRTGGKQYRVAPEDVLDVERVSGKKGAKIEFADVLLVGGGDGEPQIGTPLFSGVTVAAEVVERRRGNSIIVLRKKASRQLPPQAGSPAGTDHDPDHQ